jgi:hypothetical protein
MNFFDDSLISVYVQEHIQEIVFPIKKTGDRWNFRCSICGDSKKDISKMRGNYYTHSNSFYCFNCDSSANGLFILARLDDKSIDDVKKEFVQWTRTFNYDSYKNNDEQIVEDNVPIIKEEESDFIIPRNWIDIPSNILPILEYRKIFEADYLPKNWKLYYDEKRKRIVLPWMKDRKIDSFQLRAINNSQTPKYLFSKKYEKGVFGIDDIDENYPYVFLIEGLFDSIFIKNGVAIGGTSLTPRQEELLEPYRDKLIYMFDNQWLDKTSYKKSLKIAETQQKAQIFIWDKNNTYKDINDIAINDKKFINNLNSIDYLSKHIFSGARALMKLKWN